MVRYLPDTAFRDFALSRYSGLRAGFAGISFFIGATAARVPVRHRVAPVTQMPVFLTTPRARDTPAATSRPAPVARCRRIGPAPDLLPPPPPNLTQELVRASVLDCGSPLPLSTASCQTNAGDHADDLLFVSVNRSRTNYRLRASWPKSDMVIPRDIRWST